MQGLPGGSDGKESACNAGDLCWSLDLEGTQEKGIVAHSSVIAGISPCTAGKYCY